MKQASIGNFFTKKVNIHNSDGIDEQSLKENVSDDNAPVGSTKDNTPAPANSVPVIVDLNDLPADPSERPKITDYNHNQRDEIRRAYWAKGPCQPRGHTFPSKLMAGKPRRFVVEWFDEFPWIEYSIKKDKIYCLCCYLFRDNVGKQGGRDAFVSERFDTWSKKGALKTHVGDISSCHNEAFQKCQDLVKKNQSIAVAFHKQSEVERIKYETRLGAVIYCVRYLLKHRLPFPGHDEKTDSLCRGLFIDTLKLIADHNESIRAVLFDNAPRNCQLTSPKTQKEIIECFSKEVVKSICDEIGNDVFGLLVDESSDISKKEQMAVVLRYVDKSGFLKERFIGIVHVMDTSSSTLKAAIDILFSQNNLSMDQVRGQGYDGASNMRGEFNGLKALILRHNPPAYYVHCFAHQLQLVVVAVAKNHDGVENFFDQLSLVTTVVCASCKRKDIIRESQRERVLQEIAMGMTETGSGLNQELSLVRSGDTRWGSHHRTITGLMKLFPEVIKVLKYVKQDGTTLSNRNQASGILSYFKTLDFVFYLHLLEEVLGLTNTLSLHLQKKDQDILEAVSLVNGTKRALKTLRAKGFGGFLKKISLFSQKHDIQMLEMTDFYVTSRNITTKITNRHHFEVDIFNTVLDMQIIEFGDRFSEENTELLANMASLSPCDNFSMFDTSKLVKLSEMYPNDFDDIDRNNLLGQLMIYYHTLQQDARFSNLKGITDLARVMVETKTHGTFPLVYRLLKLTLVLPVAIATVERCFSAMKLVKSDLRNRMGDKFLNGCLICGKERETLENIPTKNVITRFHMQDRRRQLP